MATSNVVPLNQPSAMSAVQAPPSLNPDALRSLGAMLSSKFTQYENDRRLAELKWLKNARQFLGVYDPEVESQIDKNRSRAYPKLTRVKCVSFLSRMMNLLFQASDKNWGVGPSAVPNLSQEDLQSILDSMSQPAGITTPDQAQAHAALYHGVPGAVPSDEQIEAAICKFAQQRATRLETEIEDQLQELGGNKAQDYVRLCRKVLASGIQYGAGVLRGPFVQEQKQRKWQMANGRLTAIDMTVYRPRFEFAPLWDYYPDMSAKCFDQMDGQFLRMVMSKAQFVALKKRPDFFEAQISRVMTQNPTGNYKRKAHETDLRSLGSQINSSSGDTNKYEVLVWDGYVSGSELSLCGVNVPAKFMNDSVQAQVWFVGNEVIKAEVNPWVTLLDDADGMKMYHQFIFEEDESFLLGNGLPNIMRDSQMGLCAATRMAIDNASVMRVFEINLALLRTDQDVSAIDPDMMIYRDDDNPATANVPAVRAVELPMNLDKLMALGQMFQGFADQETFVGAATGGDMQKGPSEPFRTAAGASMLRGDAALPFKDVVRNFDVFTESVIGSLITFNRKFNSNPQVQGDFTPLAKGATTLIAKEVQGIQLDQLAQTLTDEEKIYLNPRGLLRARLKVRDMDPDYIVYDDSKCDQIDEQRRQATERQQQQSDRVLEANVRKTLSDVLKNIAQANKNAAGAEATIANTILDAMERGINPDMVASSATPSNGATDGSQSTAAGADAGAESAAAGTGEQQRSGLGGLEAATGAAAAAPRPRAAAMPAGPNAA
jgi:hypothetical protein